MYSVQWQLPTSCTDLTVFSKFYWYCVESKYFKPMYANWPVSDIAKHIQIIIFPFHIDCRMPHSPYHYALLMPILIMFCLATQLNLVSQLKELSARSL